MATEQVRPTRTTEAGSESRMTIDTAEWQIRITQLLTLPGILLAYYLYLFHEGEVFPSCKVGAFFDCAQVSGPTAQFAEFGGVPVALIGMVGYVAIFLVVWLKDWLPIVAENLPEILVGVTGLGFLFTLFLTALEAFVIGAFCQYCLYSAAIITVMFGLSISYMLRNRR
jgi:uncharacterized membrane protein